MFANSFFSVLIIQAIKNRKKEIAKNCDEELK